MITDVGTIDDKSFNQGTWEGIVAWAKANGKESLTKYYKPTSGTTADYVSAIDLAVEGGAKIIVTPGYLFEEAIYTCQTKYPNVKFVLIDGEPHTADYSTYKTADNTLAVLYKEDQSGFLAGYAAVKDGYTKLGFTGGLPVPAVKRYGFGYVAGIYYAAKEDGVLANVAIGDSTFEYLGSFAASDTVKATASGWYANGTEVIFSAAGGAGNSVMAAAAEKTGKWVIGVDVNQIPQSSTVISAAMKDLALAASNALTAFYSNQWKGGYTQNYTVQNNGVGIPNDYSRFKKFNKTQYDAIYALLKAGTVKVPDSYDDLATFCAALGVDTSDANKFPTKAKADASL